LLALKNIYAYVSLSCFMEMVFNYVIVCVNTRCKGIALLPLTMNV
jgi:hypothetical protein